MISLAWQRGKPVAEVAWICKWTSLRFYILYHPALKILPCQHTCKLDTNTLKWVSKNWCVSCPREVNHSYSQEKTKANIGMLIPGLLLLTTDQLPILTWWETEALPFVSYWFGSLPAGLACTTLLVSICDFRRGWHLGEWEVIWKCPVMYVFLGLPAPRFSQLVRLRSCSRTVFFSCLFLPTCAQFINTCFVLQRTFYSSIFWKPFQLRKFYLINLR